MFGHVWSALDLRVAWILHDVVHHVVGVRGQVYVQLCWTVLEVGLPTKVLALSLVNVDDFHVRWCEVVVWCGFSAMVVVVSMEVQRVDVSSG